MRERLSEEVEINSNSRITPAYAGKTVKSIFWAIKAWDHPRVCGKDW